MTNFAEMFNHFLKKVFVDVVLATAEVEFFHSIPSLDNKKKHKTLRKRQ